MIQQANKFYLLNTAIIHLKILNYTLQTQPIKKATLSLACSNTVFYSFYQILLLKVKIIAP